MSNNNQTKCCGGDCGCKSSEEQKERAREYADDLARHIRSEAASNQLSPVNHSLLRRIESFLREIHNK